MYAPQGYAALILNHYSDSRFILETDLEEGNLQAPIRKENLAPYLHDYK